MKKLSYSLLLSGLILLSCNQDGEPNERTVSSSGTMSSAQDVSTDSIEQSPNGKQFPSESILRKDSIKLIKTAHLRLKVRDVEKEIRSVSEFTTEFGGMIYNTSFHSREGDRNELRISDDSIMTISNYTPQADITCRIPSDSLLPFIFRITELGYHTNSASLQIDDKTLFYLKNQLSNNNRREILEEIKGTPLKFPAASQKIRIKDEMTDQQITNKQIDAEVKYSMVSLNIYQNAIVKKEMIANYSVADVNLPFGKRLSHSLQSGWDLFLNLFLFFARLSIFIFIGLTIYFAYRHIQKKRNSVIVPQ
jgi:hypothetical protein